MNDKLDEGNIITSKEITITKTDTYGHLHDKLATLTATMITEFINQFQNNTNLTSIPQNHQQASYCKKIKSKKYKLNIKHPIEITLAKIKAYSPKPGAYISINNKTIKILDAKIESGKLIPIKVQPEGKNVMLYKDYLLGNKNEINLC